MREHKIEIEVDEKGNIKAETFGMQGDVCASELDKILSSIKGKRKVVNTPEYYKPQSTKQTIKR